MQHDSPLYKKMKKRICILLLCLVTALFCNAQKETKKDSLSLLFVGDIMGHDAQILAAKDTANNTYKYDGVFKYVRSFFYEHDFTLGNLEVCLAGQPYKGYPSFSSPDELAASCQRNGINVLFTSNNHTLDRGKKGLFRTIDVLDSLKIMHTGSFKDSLNRVEKNLLIIQKNNIKVGFINYTYNSNRKLSDSCLLNIIDSTIILNDLKQVKQHDLDKIIAVLHWGNEYQNFPSKYQKKYAKLLFKNGVDIIIGAHPHVLQKMEYQIIDSTKQEHLIAYSLGNFVSNQRKRKRDGGTMLSLTLEKSNDTTKITRKGYYLTWVHTPTRKGKKEFEILPCSLAENHQIWGIDSLSMKDMNIFIDDSRELFKKNNLNISEIKTGKQVLKQLPYKRFDLKIEFLKIQPPNSLKYPSFFARKSN